MSRVRPYDRLAGRDPADERSRSLRDTAIHPPAALPARLPAPPPRVILSSGSSATPRNASCLARWQTRLASSQRACHESTDRRGGAAPSWSLRRRADPPSLRGGVQQRGQRWLGELAELLAFPTVSSLPDHRRHWTPRRTGCRGTWPALVGARWILSGPNGGPPGVYADWLVRPAGRSSYSMATTTCSRTAR